jgi:hypothetical protein
VCAFAGCGDASNQRATAGTRCPPVANGPLRLDEHAGTVGDVRIGQLRTDVTRHFRSVPRKSSTSSVAALGNCGAPQLGGVWIPKHFRTLRMGDMTLLFGGAPARLYAINLFGRGAQTAGGVAIGDALGDVKRVYAARHPTCDTLADDDGPLYPACWVRVGPQFLYFGGDPIAQISLQPPKNHAPPATPRDRV